MMDVEAAETRELLESLRCPEPHGTGRGSCSCQRNDIVDELLERFSEVSRALLNVTKDMRGLAGSILDLKDRNR